MKGVIYVERWLCKEVEIAHNHERGVKLHGCGRREGELLAWQQKVKHRVLNIIMKRKVGRKARERALNKIRNDWAPPSQTSSPCKFTGCVRKATLLVSQGDRGKAKIKRAIHALVRDCACLQDSYDLRRMIEHKR